MNKIDITGVTTDNDVDIIDGIYNVYQDLYDNVLVRITYEVEDQYYETGRTNIQMTKSERIANEWLINHKKVKIITNYKAKVEWQDDNGEWNKTDKNLRLNSEDVENIKNKLYDLSRRNVKIL